MFRLWSVMSFSGHSIKVIGRLAEDALAGTDGSCANALE